MKADRNGVQGGRNNIYMYYVYIFLKISPYFGEGTIPPASHNTPFFPTFPHCNTPVEKSPVFNIRNGKKLVTTK